MSDEIPEAAETPLPDMVRGLVHELRAGWRLKAEAPDGLASHSCGRALSAEVGRILASEWPLMRDPRHDETLTEYVNQIPQFAEVVVVGVVARLIKRAQVEERERCAKIADVNMNNGPLDAAQAIRSSHD